MVSEVKSIFLLIIKTSLKSGLSSCLKWQIPKMDMFFGFDIYCSKNETSCAKNAQVMDPDCTQTTRTVVGLLDSVQLLGKGHYCVP